MKRAATYLPVRMKIGPLDVVYIVAAAITIIVEGPAAWNVISQVYQDAATGVSQAWPEPIIIMPPDGIPFTYPPDGGPGVPSGQPGLISFSDPTGGILDPDLDIRPFFDFPGDLDFVFGCLGLDDSCVCEETVQETTKREWVAAPAGGLFATEMAFLVNGCCASSGGDIPVVHGADTVVRYRRKKKV